MEEPRARFLFIFPGPVKIFTQVNLIHGTLMSSSIHSTREDREDKVQTLSSGIPWSLKQSLKFPINLVCTSVVHIFTTDFQALKKQLVIF